MVRSRRAGRTLISRAVSSCRAPPLASSALLCRARARGRRRARHPPPPGFLDRRRATAWSRRCTARLVPNDDGSPARTSAGSPTTSRACCPCSPAPTPTPTAGPAPPTSPRDRAGRSAATIAAPTSTATAWSTQPTSRDGRRTRSSADRAGGRARLRRPTHLFAGGPFSGRTPFPDPATGTPSNHFPPTPSSPRCRCRACKRLAWTVRLLGADAVPEVAGQPARHDAPDVDLRRRYRDGLAKVHAISDTDFGAPFDELTTAQQDTIVTTLKRQHPHLLRPARRPHDRGHVVRARVRRQSRRVIGWKLIGFDGDSQPLGYTIFDATIDDYRERPDKPNSTIDPDDPCSGFSATCARFLRSVLVRLARRQSSPNRSASRVSMGLPVRRRRTSSATPASTASTPSSSAAAPAAPPRRTC